MSRSIKYFKSLKNFSRTLKGVCVWKSQPWHVPLILRIIVWDYQRSLCALKLFFNLSFVHCTGCLFAVAGNLPTWAGLLCRWLDGWQSDTCLQNKAIDQDVMSYVGCTYFDVAFAHYVPLKKETWQDVQTGSFIRDMRKRMHIWVIVTKLYLLVDTDIAWLG